MGDKYRRDIDETVEYYEKNADAFIKSTINANVSELYKPFEKLLTPGCRILDLGCGSGRDSKYFADKGYEVVAIDPSPAMCAQTKALAHIPVYEMKAEEMSFSNEFEAVWACASLLHVPCDKMTEIFMKIANALKEGGVLYASWKYGDRDRLSSGRFFSDMNEAILLRTIRRIDSFRKLRIWITDDVRTEKVKQKWLNALFIKLTE